MRTKLKQDFEITYPLTHKVVRDLKIVTEHVGDLIVTGTAFFDSSASVLDVYDRYAVDIDFIKWNGTDIKPVIEVMDRMDDINEYCIHKASSLFEEKEVAA